MRNVYTSKNESGLYRFDRFGNDGARFPKAIAVASDCSVALLIGAVNDLNCPLLTIEVLRRLEKRFLGPSFFTLRSCARHSYVFRRMTDLAKSYSSSHPANDGILGQSGGWTAPGRGLGASAPKRVRKG